MKTETKNKVPGATIRGEFNTYEDMKYYDINERLGHVVTLRLENLCDVECAAWFAGLKIRTMPGVKVSQSVKTDGSTEITLSL